MMDDYGEDEDFGEPKWQSVTRTILGWAARYSCGTFFLYIVVTRFEPDMLSWLDTTVDWFDYVRWPIFGYLKIWVLILLAYIATVGYDLYSSLRK